MKIRYKKLFFVCLLAFFIFLPPTVSALEIDYPNFFGLTITNNSSLPEYAKYFFNLGMGIAGLLALMVITIGGTYYLISFAGGKFTSNGKEWIKSGIVGLLILLSSYLIAYTINPNLVVFKLEELIPILSRVFPLGNPPQKQIPTVYYKEIPVGVITENLVSRTKDCYDFDPEGNPIDGEKIKIKRDIKDDEKTIILPTYLDHDRVDCVLKLVEASQKKSKVIKDLSDKIINLMEQCSCKDVGACDLTSEADCSVDKYPNEEGLCVGKNCVKAGCQGENDCCPPGVRDQIEGIGEARIEIIDCQGNVKEYKGLEEFRTKLFTISRLIESQISVGGKIITIIDKIKWQGLNLREQLMYINEKISQIQSEIELDRSQLEFVKADMASSSCRYIIKSSADLLKIKEAAEKDKKAIGIQKTYIDPIKRDIINSSKYCNGFNYSNSSCFKTCQDKCPDSSFQAAELYANCGSCKIDDKKCLAEQQTCIEKKYNERPCVFSNSPEDDTFEGCIESCRGGCVSLCQKRYLYCSSQLQACETQCYNNSKCVLENKEACLIEGRGFQGCGAENNDAGNFKNCVDDAYLCKYGSNEYAGYPDCLKTKNPIFYSSPYLFANPNLLRCPNPYATAVEEGTQTYCLDVFEETAKCPPSSKCPKCPCGSVDEIISFSDEVICPPGECLGSDGVCSPGECGVGQNGSQSENQSQISVKKNVLVTGECSEFAYNQDPLIFYCRIGWEPEGPLGGKWSGSSKVEEIPIGQTVDNSEKWANELIGKINSFNDKVKEMLDHMKKIGDKKKDKYCMCNSKYDDDNEDSEKAGKPICTNDCEFFQEEVEVIDPVTEEVTIELQCFCLITPCDGNPCAQMMDYLREVTNFYQQIKQGFVDFYVYFISEERTDVLKELTYSRKTMNNCSQQVVKIGEEIIKPLSCTKAYGNNFLDKRCYGILEGETKGENLTDNWFCPKEDF